MGPYTGSSTSGDVVAGHPERTPSKDEFDVIRDRIASVEKRVSDLEDELTATRDYLRLLHERHADMILRDSEGGK